jgi:cellulose synthase/poly-beta-1,6-N-acetylglucosamine synthase-like glycosyltransferase
MGAVSIFFLKQISENAIYVAIFMTPLLSLLIIIQNIRPWEKSVLDTLITITTWFIAGVASFLITEQNSSLVFAFVGLILTLCIKQFNKNYFVTGYMFLVNTLIIAVFGTIWGVTFILTENLSMVTQVLLAIGLITLSFSLPIGLATLLPVNSYLFRKKWLRPSKPMLLANLPQGFYPKVSLHLPCYEEPPEIVIASLKALSELEYPNFEVIVIDNNTKDEKLWHPVKQYCEQLGSNFHFYHVSPLKGAKAGALNFALEHTDEKAEIIGIIDADYQANSNFIKDLVGFFNNEKIGFVQTPHDYRSWKENRFVRNCYWEYIPAYRLKIACLNEWVASYIIGTMCLIRKKALEEAGGWSEWCLTEDAECALRIHALGYSSIYINQTYGRGVIPENFYDYKKQRLRWTIGPIQQLKRHWKLLLPVRFSKPSKLSNWQRLLEFSHSLREISPIAATIFIPIGLVTVGSIIYHHETITIPLIIWIATAVTLPSLLAISWLTYRLAGCKSILDMIGAAIATQSLTHVRLMGSIIGLFGNLAWKKTNKFKLEPGGIKAFYSAKSEITIAAIFFALSYLIGINSSVSPPDILFLSAMAMFTAGVRYLAAPTMVLISEIELHRARNSSKKKIQINYEFSEEYAKETVI